MYFAHFSGRYTLQNHYIYIIFCSINFPPHLHDSIRAQKTNFLSSDQITSFQNSLIQMFFCKSKLTFMVSSFHVRSFVGISSMKSILMQHTANCLVTHSFACNIFATIPRSFGALSLRFVSYFINYMPFFCSTKHFSLWFSRHILYGSSKFKLINNILYSLICFIDMLHPIFCRQ